MGLHPCCGLLDPAIFRQSAWKTYYGGDNTDDSRCRHCRVRNSRTSCIGVYGFMLRCCRYHCAATHFLDFPNWLPEWCCCRRWHCTDQFIGNLRWICCTQCQDMDGRELCIEKRWVVPVGSECI